MAQQLLQVRDVKKSFATDGTRTEILRGVSFSLMRGETLALTGESGSGKSTLLHLLGGLDSPDAGQILIKDQDVAVLSDKDRAALRRNHVGLVFQQFNLIPSLDVASNIAFQARLGRCYDIDFNRTLADRLGLSEHLSKYPEQLSGGQQQRVAIARTLAVRPALVLADEPTGNLDETTGQDVLDLMLDLVHQTDCALITVTHSETVAQAMGRRLHLKNGVVAP